MSINMVDRATGKITILRLDDRKTGRCYLRNVIRAYNGGRGFVPIDGTDLYITDAETIKFWKRYIDNHYAVEEAIDSLRKELEEARIDNIDEVIEFIQDTLENYSIEIERTVAEKFIKEARDEYLSDHTVKATNMIG